MTILREYLAMLVVRSFVRSISAIAVAAIALGSAGSEAKASKRVALVIGNSAYENASTLANPANDASDMAIALRDLGFDVTVGVDLDSRSMRQKVREFGTALRGAEVAMLYYAGHAIQVNGRNYLAPVDTQLEYESDVDFETIPLQFIQRQMEREAKTILLFLDACRDNPLTRSFIAASRSQGAGKGLAEEKLSTSGIMIAFATNPGNVALDGKGRNSPFTKAMLDNIRRPGVEISTLMTDVRVQVVRDTNGQQTPWINSALLGRFYFNPEGAAAAESETTSAQNSADKVASLQKSDDTRGNGAGVDNARIEALAWDAVKESNNIQELETFLQVYGSGFYAKLARIRIDRLKAEQAKTADAQTAADKPEEPKTEEVAKLEEPTESSRTVQPEIDPRELARSLQQELAQLNCNPGRPDGLWGRRSAAALDRFAQASKLKLVSTSPDPKLLDQIREYGGKGCPQPVVRSCPSGQKMNSKGVCYTPSVRQASAPAKTTTRSVNRQPQPQPQPQVQPQPQQPQVIVQEPPQPGQQIIVQQPGQQIIVQQPIHQQPVIMPQPQPQPRPGFGTIGRVGGAVITCIVAGC